MKNSLVGDHQVVVVDVYEVVLEGSDMIGTHLNGFLVKNYIEGTHGCLQRMERSRDRDFSCRCVHAGGVPLMQKNKRDTAIWKT